MPPERMLVLLMHVLLLPDVVSSCPTEEKTLILDPPDIIIKYGEELLVNCSTKIEDFMQMYWSDGISQTVTEEENTFIPWFMSVSDWNVNASCTIQLSDSVQCSKNLKITVYKSPDEVYLRPVNALVEGRQHQLHCDIINVAPVQNLTVRWYKSDTLMKTESFNQTTKTPVNESSTLLVNISRGDSGVQFRCEAELDFDSDTLVTSDLLNVSVHYAPEFNNITSEVLHVEKGSDVTLTCDIDANPPPQYEWSRDGENMVDNTNSLTVTDINVNADYNCTASNYLGSKTKQIYVYVATVVTTAAASAPVDDCSPTLIPSDLVVRFGEPASIYCNISVSNFLGMGWEATIGGTGFITSPFATWKVDRLEVWDPKPSCFVTLLNVQQCNSSPSITVYKSPDEVYLRPVNALVEGRQHQLHCDIINVAPVQNLTVRWYKSDTLMKTESFNQTTKTPVNESSTLLVNISRGDSGVQFRCEAELDFDSDTLVTSDLLNVSVHYAPELNNITGEVLHVEKGSDVTLTCDIDANPPPQYEWSRDGENMLDNTNSLTVTDINVNADYTCTASNYLGSKTKQIHVYVATVVTTAAASAPVDDCSLTLIPSELVVRFGDPASIYCNISVSNFLGMGWEATIGGTGFIRSPFATWTVDRLEVWDPNPTCFVTLSDGHQCSLVPSVTVYKTPDQVSVSPLSHKPMVEGTDYLLECDIINVAPVQNLTVRWYRGSEHVHTEMFNNKSDFAPKTPQNQSSTLRVSPERGHNGTPFKCEAVLHLGPEVPQPVSTSSAPYIAVVHFAPTFTRGNPREEVSLGGNVTFGCHAEGNPAPDIRWNYTSADNVREATWGRQKNITIQEATSTNAGLYICLATNEVGSVTRLVTVTIKGEAAAGVPGFSWWYLPLIIVSVFIVVFVVTRMSQCHKKHGRYSFITVRTSEEIPLGTKSAAVGAS